MVRLIGTENRALQPERERRRAQEVRQRARDRNQVSSPGFLSWFLPRDQQRGRSQGSGKSSARGKSPGRVVKHE